MLESTKFEKPCTIAVAFNNESHQIYHTDEIAVDKDNVTFKLNGRNIGGCRRSDLYSWKQIEDNESDNPPPIGSYGAP